MANAGWLANAFLRRQSGGLPDRKDVHLPGEDGNARRETESIKTISACSQLDIRCFKNLRAAEEETLLELGHNDKAGDNQQTGTARHPDDVPTHPVLGSEFREGVPRTGQLEDEPLQID